MVTGDDNRKIAECFECGSVYASQDQADGSLRPIGTPLGCRCGNAEFTEADRDEILETG